MECLHLKPEIMPSSITPFQHRVYTLLGTVPRGRVVTYGDLARAVGCRSARPIGGALRRNPQAPQIPCHRVIAADGTPGGFKGRTATDSIAEKTALLAEEGVEFHNGRLADRGRLFKFNSHTTGSARQPPSPTP